MVNKLNKITGVSAANSWAYNTIWNLNDIYTAQETEGVIPKKLKPYRKQLKEAENWWFNVNYYTPLSVAVLSGGTVLNEAINNIQNIVSGSSILKMSLY